ncbi:MAG TPA: BamA/TamA family outer membrane protein [Polyangiaceae bacterium]|nr:BamA/TamA family outer membrane protein [Polyangiaceae bacterium]
MRWSAPVRRLRHFARVGALLLLLSGCYRRPDVGVGGPIIDALDIVGGDAVDVDRLKQGLATQATERFLFMRGVIADYETLDEALLERDLERVERFFQARGFYEAKVTGARVIRTGADSVRVLLVVNQGSPVLIGAAGGPLAVQLSGLETVDDSRVVAAIIAASPEPGDVLDEDDYERAKREMRHILADGGYAFAKVSGRSDVDLSRHEARLRFQIEAGPHARFGEVKITGLTSVPENVVRQSLLIAAGDDYSASALEDARRSLVNLGVFAAVNVNADTSRPESGRVPVEFSVQETAPRTIRLGGGARLDALQLSSSLTASWEHRNFLGGLRQLALEARPGVVLFPTRMSDFPSLSAPDRVMMQGSLEARFAQPSFIEGRTKGLLSASVEVRPLLYTETGTDEPILGFLEIATRAGLERPFFSHTLFLTPAINWQAALPIDYRDLTLGTLSPSVESREVENLYMVYPELTARLDLRDDPLDPKRGFLLSNSLQVALPILGGSVSDLRIRPEARFYITKSRLTLAVRGTTGLLFPRNYDADDKQAILFRGFFSGGPFSNRGYAFQGVGRHGTLPLSSDGGVPCNATQMPPDPGCLRPLGGLTLWEASVELRFPLRFVDPLGMVVFLDSSDVRPGRADYGLDTPHLAPGIGLRYPTPVGPVRFDVGFRLLEALGNEDPEGSPPTLFGAPLTLHLAVGQAF